MQLIACHIEVCQIRVLLFDRLVFLVESLVFRFDLRDHFRDTFRGFQSGLVNVAGDAEGLQLSLVNYAKKYTGLQIGLVNIIKEGGMLPFFPIFNIGTGGD